MGALVREGVDTVFGIPGAQTYELFDALGRASDHIRVLAPRHEQAASYMAFGYARSTGRTGVYSVVPGPGVLNSSAGLCTAYGASAPVVCLTSEVPTPYIGVGLGHLHELPDQLGTLRTLTKWAGADRSSHRGARARHRGAAARRGRAGRAPSRCRRRGTSSPCAQPWPTTRAPARPARAPRRSTRTPSTGSRTCSRTHGAPSSWSAAARSTRRPRSSRSPSTCRRPWCPFRSGRGIVSSTTRSA